MSKARFIYTGGQPYVIVKEKSRYGFAKFLLDLFMIFLTAGLWIIWIIIREIKND
jgi:hypothetical protein